MEGVNLKVTLYSTHCPICNMVETKLKEKGITYQEVNDTNIMLNKGFKTVPMLEVDNKIMNSSEAIQFINTYSEGNN